MNSDGKSSNEIRVHRDFRPKVGRVLGRIPFTAELVAAYYYALNPAAPAAAKALLLSAMAYFIMPVDLVAES